jgi:dTMP kinase
MFISFEGGEGSGKTTQAKMLVERLNNQGIKAVFTREPGGTPLAEEIRAVLLSGSEVKDPMTEFLLICAARMDHVNNFIKPKIAEGYIVVCDRFFDSTLTYQGYMKGLDMDLMRKIHTDVLADFAPDLTFLVDIDTAVAATRITGRGGSANHYDSMDASMHEKIRAGLLELARKDTKRCVIIDGAKLVEDVASDIYAVLAGRIG